VVTCFETRVFKRRENLTFTAAPGLLAGIALTLPTSERAHVQVTDGNALSNGLKFGTHLAADVTSTGTSATICFDDDGPGITGDERARVFEPFFRAQSAQRIAGHGLGLALIRHIATTHGGNAVFVDKPKPGARLEITLPRHGS